MAFASDVINRVYLTHFLEAHDVWSSFFFRIYGGNIELDFKLDLSYYPLILFKIFKIQNQ